MRKSPSLIEFIRYGRFGAIKIGAKSTDVERTFGHSSSIRMWAPGQELSEFALKYDDLYFGLLSGKDEIAYIGIRPSKGSEVKLGKYSFSDTVVNAKTSVEEFEKYIVSQGIVPVSKLRWDLNGWVYNFESGVEVSFYPEIGEEPYLYEICISKH